MTVESWRAGEILDALVAAERRRALREILAALPRLSERDLDDLQVAIDAQRARGIGRREDAP